MPLRERFGSVSSVGLDLAAAPTTAEDCRIRINGNGSNIRVDWIAGSYSPIAGAGITADNQAAFFGRVVVLGGLLQNPAFNIAAISDPEVRGGAIYEDLPPIFNQIVNVGSPFFFPLKTIFPNVAGLTFILTLANDFNTGEPGPPTGTNTYYPKLSVQGEILPNLQGEISLPARRKQK